MNFDFGEVLTRAGQITWKHKVLWLGGVLVGLLGILSLPINFLINPSVFELQMTSPRELGSEMWRPLLGGVLIIFLSILSIPVNVVGMTLPSLGTIRVERGETERLRFVELVKGTFPYFWRILGMFLIVGVGAFAVLGVFFACIALLSVVTMGIAALCAFPLFIVLIPLLILLYAVVEQALSAILVDNLSTLNALQFAWDLVKKNLGVMILLSIIIYVGSAIVSMIISVPLMIPMFSMMFKMGTPPDPQMMDDLFQNMTSWMLAFSPIYLVFQGILFTFIQSAWTLTYMRLTHSPAASEQLQPDNAPPAEPDSNKTILAAEPKDSNKTLIASEPTDSDRTVIGKKPDV
jgi:hypothetical protein